MKSIKSYILLLLLSVFSLNSCSDYFGDINLDPDNPLSVTPDVLLSQIEARIAYVVGGDASRYIGIYTQHVDGCCRQFFVYQNYGVQGVDVDVLWGQNLYSSILMDNRQLLTQAEANGYNHYAGVSKAIEAYAMMLLTDLFGDAPYSDAFQGTDLLQPQFDTQEEIYTAIFRLITESRALLAMEDAGVLFPGPDDLIYGGDLAKWGKFLNTIEARGRLHLSNVNADNYQAALDALDRGAFEGEQDDAIFGFALAATSSAPWFQYTQQRDDIDVGANYVALMEGLNDPRGAVYGAPIDQGVPHPILVADRQFPLLTYTEQEFIRAEATLETRGATAAHPIYLNAIRSSFNDAGLSESAYNDYIAQAAVDPGAASLTMEEVMTQKYIALFLDPEVFTDWRRTGIPDLTPNSGSQIPRRLPYAQNEVLSNTNTPSPTMVTQFTPVWWDQ
ncbi:MAG: SusD/RagB family nutrient-binding outer membrane lipoprotein [Bacteroidota bacterium]